MNAVEAAWELLLQAGRREDGWHCRRLDCETEVPILAAIQRPGDIPSLLVECSSSSVPPVPELPSCRGFRLCCQQLLAGPHGRVRLCLTLEDPRYRDVFGVLAGDVFLSIGPVLLESQLVRVLLGRLHSWQVFMQHHAEGLTIEEQIGLAAECVVLRQLLAGGIPAHSVVTAWEGPSGASRDFLFPQAVIEVKGTADPRPTVHISSLEQLEDAAAAPVLLAVVSMRQGQGDMSLPTLVDGIRGTIGGEDVSALADFDRKLLDAGYLDIHRERYLSRLIAILSVRFYRVAPGFPRVTRADVNRGVDSCAYNIRLVDCLPFEVSWDVVLGLVGVVGHE